MNLKDALTWRVNELCNNHGLNPNSLANLSGMDRSTVYSMLGEKSRSPEVATIKKICDGLGITLGDFFTSPVFDGLEQEIK